MSLLDKIGSTMTSVSITVEDTSGQKYEMRPYTIKEENTLMLARTFNDTKPLEVLKTLKGIIKGCNKDGKLDIKKLDSYDLQYIFLQLRVLSRGDRLRVNLECQHEECQDSYEMDESENPVSNVAVKDIILSDIKFIKDNKDYNLIEVDIGGSSPLYIEMMEPSEEVILKAEEKFPNENMEVDRFLWIVSRSIKSITLDDDKEDGKDLDQDRFKKEVLDNLPTNQIEKFQPFFENLPRFETHVEWICPRCKQENKKEIRGLDGFLA